MAMLYHRRGRAWRAVLCAASLALASCAAKPPPVGQNAGECLAQLDRLGLRYQLAALSPRTPAACRVEAPVEVSAATLPFNQPAVASCALILQFDRFEREALRPLAQRYLREDIKTILHFGAYSCRTTHAGRESEHAHGLAIDVAGFELADGRRVLVKDDWSKRDREGRFLHAVAQAACRYFNEVLTPESDRDHANHIHLDLGPYTLCVRR